ncbi:uncharacterized protein LOC144102151 [Amblyomma americanum]
MVSSTSNTSNSFSSMHLSEYGPIINKAKCDFGKPQFDFLGHRVHRSANIVFATLATAQYQDAEIKDLLKDCTEDPPPADIVTSAALEKWEALLASQDPEVHSRATGILSGDLFVLASSCIALCWLILFSDGYWLESFRRQAAAMAAVKQLIGRVKNLHLSEKFQRTSAADGRLCSDGDGTERPTNGSNVVVTVNDLRRLGVPKLNKTVRDYYQSGADQEQTLHENVEAFKRWRLLYRVLVNVASRRTTATMLGKEVSMPLGIAPSAMQKMAHPDGEIGTATASQDAGTVMILSTLSSTSIEDLRKAAPDATLWLQLYVFKNRTVTEQLLQRACSANFSAVVLTVDAPTWGQRIVDVRNAFTIPEGITNFNLRNATSGSGLTKYTNDFFDQSLTWNDVNWLKNITSLPIVLKGIMTRKTRPYGSV